MIGRSSSSASTEKAMDSCRRYRSLQRKQRTVNSDSLDNASLSGESVKRAKYLLRHVIILFQQAEEASRRFEVSHSERCFDCR